MFKSILLLLFLLTTQLVHSQGSLKKSSALNSIHNTMKELQIVKSEIIRLLGQVDDTSWQTFHLIIEAPPFTNKGFNSTPIFLDARGNQIKVSWKEDWDYVQKVLDLIFEMNQKEIRNQIIFFTNRGDYNHATIFTSFSQNIEDAFQSRLPKSKRGKTIAWFKAGN